MKQIILSGKGIIIGKGSLSYLSKITYKSAFIVTGGSSMTKNGIISKAVAYLEEAQCNSFVYAGIGKNPTIQEVMAGLKKMNEILPDVVIAIGGGSAMDAAKAMVLFYEFPTLTFENVLEKNMVGEIPSRRKTGLICVASTSGTGSEVTRGTVITDPQRELKVPIMTDCLRPDIAILDAEITMTMPSYIAAETGMDALTHAIEAYTNHNLDDFNEGLCRAAIEGIMKWLPVSCKEQTLESREKVHNYQAMAGIGFSNVGLGMVHGIAHSFGAIYNMAHGLTNAVILPYVLTYNSRDPIVAEKLKNLSYHCRCEDIIEEIKNMGIDLGIPVSFQEANITQEEYKNKYDLLLDHAMLGATNANPVKMNRQSMAKMIDAVYYGKEIDF